METWSVGQAAQGHSASKGHQAAPAPSRWQSLPKATLPLPSGDMAQEVWLSGTDFQSYPFLEQSRVQSGC